MIVESGAGEALSTPPGYAREAVIAIPGGPHRTMDPSVFRRLVSRGLVQHVQGRRYRVTSFGREVHDRSKNPATSG